MKKALLALAFACAALAGCAEFQAISGAYTLATTATVTAQQVAIAASGFDGLENSAVVYLKLPLCTGAQGTGGAAYTCRTQAVSQTVYTALLKGRAARNQLEAQINSGSNGTTSVYNVLVAAINTLQGYFTSSSTAAK